MKKSAWLALPAVLGLSVALADSQITVPRVIALPIVALQTHPLQIASLQISEHHFPTPPPPLDPQVPDKTSPTNSRHIDLVQLQRDADDLSRTAQTIPGDIASLRKGMLPKDVIEKLKQIEKLSKRLRTELNP